MRTAAVNREMRDVIIDASERLLVRYGYRKMTMDDVAKEAAIGKGTIYLYFRSKEELALSSADRFTKQVQASLRAAANGPGAPATRLRHMLVLRVLLRFDHVQPFAQSLDDLYSALRPAFLARRQQWMLSEADILAEVLTEGKLLGAFQLEDPVGMASTLILATNSLMPFSLSPQELGARNDVERKARQIADLALRGVLRRDSPRSDSILEGE